ncbi:MAG: WecB/TagA/CpsF family glycosyltransferase [Chloroflexi bacterium]|nr:WecB/TagA/CpsF family glycosyltransferase [Chloroflexota bacterium]
MADIRILGVRVDLFSADELRQELKERLAGPETGLCAVTTVNAECLALASQDNAYRETVNRAALNIVDGAGVALVARLRGHRAERVTGADLVVEIAGMCAARGARMFLLGSTQAVADAARQRLQGLHPKLEVETHSPPDLPSHDLPPEEDEKLFERLLAFRPRVLCVALGMPKQELWIDANRPRLEEAGVRIAVGVGGTLEYLAGAVPRAPALVQRLGLEWLYRLVREPRKRLHRQVTRLPRFLVLASLEALRLRFQGGRSRA